MSIEPPDATASRRQLGPGEALVQVEEAIVRDAGAKDGRVVGSIRRGAIVRITAVLNQEWAFVEYTDQGVSRRGYVHLDDLDARSTHGELRRR